ncbi:MAG: glucokinase [Clostridiales bacterium GWF2_38_85]|nr:MAG: glucokinase [Clostridiales bacterium GWF2_38_85]HBL84141.1 glucokinase [Clostridiales bacterium]
MNYYIGVDLGGTKIAAGITDESGKILIKDSVPTLAEREADEIVKDMAKLCLSLAERMNLTMKDIRYVGVATPGIANQNRGTVDYSCNLPMVNYPLVQRLQNFLGIKKVLIENDANAAALGETICGAAQNCNNSVMITLGTGVGGGCIINRKVYSGFNFCGPELGHIVIEHDGVPCSCGRKGCWESYSSATALIRMTKEKLLLTKDTIMWEMTGNDINKVSGKTAFTASKQGDKAGQEVVDKYIGYLASGIVSVINIFQPEVLSIGGGVSGEGDYLLKPLMKIVDKEEYARDSTARTKIKIAQLGNDAGIIGAAMLGI